MTICLRVCNNENAPKWLWTCRAKQGIGKNMIWHCWNQKDCFLCRERCSFQKCSYMVRNGCRRFQETVLHDPEHLGGGRKDTVRSRGQYQGRPPDSPEQFPHCRKHHIKICKKQSGHVSLAHRRYQWTVSGNTHRWSQTVATLLGTWYKQIRTCIKTVLACIKCYK